MSYTREYNRNLIAYINHKLTQPRRLDLGGGAGEDGGDGAPPGGITGQLPQMYVCYDTTEADTAGSTATAGCLPSLVHNLNRIRGGWAIGDEAIHERHMYWATSTDIGTSGCIASRHVPFYSSSGCIPSTNVRDAIEYVYFHVVHPTDFVWTTFTFSVAGDITVDPGAMALVSPTGMTIDHVYGWIDTPPTGQAAIMDVNKNGVSILDGSRLQIAAGANSGTATPVDTTLSQYDRLTMDVDQRGTTVAGSDLTVMVFCRQPIG